MDRGTNKNAGARFFFSFGLPEFARSRTVLLTWCLRFYPCDKLLAKNGCSVIWQERVQDNAKIPSYHWLWNNALLCSLSPPPRSSQSKQDRSYRTEARQCWEQASTKLYTIWQQRQYDCFRSGSPTAIHRSQTRSKTRTPLLWIREETPAAWRGN